jgi:energy-converting hydrogenase Eha subunit E
LGLEGHCQALGQEEMSTGGVVLVYLSIGIVLAAMAFTALWLQRKLGQPDHELEMHVQAVGVPLMFIGLVLLWPVMVAMAWIKR